MSLGKAKAKNGWELGYQYFVIEANATFSNFSESDIGGGGANREAHKISFVYQLLENIQVAWINWFADDTIVDADPSTADGVWKTQLDGIYKF